MTTIHRLDRKTTRGLTRLARDLERESRGALTAQRALASLLAEAVALGACIPEVCEGVEDWARGLLLIDQPINEGLN